MNPTQLLAHFDRLAEGPDAIPNLRSFILDLAVRGKLVSQDPNDEPAAELLKRIQVEKTKFFKSGTIRRIEDYPPVTLDESWCAIPPSWVYARLGAITNVAMGTSPPGSTYNTAGEGLPLINGPVEFTAGPFGKTIVNQYTTEPTNLCESGDFLICVRGSTTGRTNIAAFRGCIGRGVAAIQPIYEDHYVRLCVCSRRRSIIEMGRGIAFPSISRGQLENLVIPFPPLAEQRRIVAKVDELMALCDRLEAAQAEREGRRKRLVRASLQRLNQPASDAATFRDHARLTLDHLGRLTTRPEHIAQLRQSILNLAICGKLVPQDLTVEPAPSFGISVDAEEKKNRLKLSLPRGWSWARVDDVAESRLGKMLDKAKNSGKPYPYLRNTNVHWFEIRMDELKTMRIEDSEIDNFLLREGDVLICEGGHGIGRAAVWRAIAGDYVFQKALHRVRPGPLLASEFFAQCVFVYYHAGILQTYYTGVGIPHFTGVALSKLVFPLPPLAEQHRIVAKVDELMALCVPLESQLGNTQTESRRLLDAVLHEALAPVL
jgi:type I restriction enzyme S subunit